MGAANLTQSRDADVSFRGLVALGGASVVLYAAVAVLSHRFVFGEGFTERPLLAVLALFAACFALYTAAIALGVKCRADRRLAAAIIVPAIVFRLALLTSEPIQEIDVYRYLWDGAAAAHGVNPFRYAPEQVRAADADDGELPADLRHLAELRDRSASLGEALQRIHFGELTTVYPPVSQVVFAMAEWTIPAGASVFQRVTIFKAVLLLFDGATIYLVWLLLRMAGRHPAWVIAYAWCPLVLKEFANSGHLDAIAVCFTTAAVWLTAKSLFDSRCRRPALWGAAGAVFLGLAVGAKLYGVVLVPLLVGVAFVQVGWRHAVKLGLIALAVSGVLLAPMLLTEPAAASSPQSPQAGLAVFMTRWEMNDFLFMLLVENLRPSGASAGSSEVWFAVVPDAWRKALIEPLASRLAVDAGMAAFLVTRAFTSVAFLAVALGLAWRASRRRRLDSFLEAAFLTLAWFWLLSPTQNPWYWTWALPLLPFARGRAWWAVSGIAFAYYLRFWLAYHYPEGPVGGTSYGGQAFFDYVVTWIEFAPWFACLCVAAWRRDAPARDASGADGRG
ncbi:MAG: hypothetical protein KY475_11500 [Planctomycetes bacterium]|nr:hypothetical protein [Planctomycetota bacterium]